jgi:hypothetical protein
VACIYRGKPGSLRRERARQRSEASVSWRDSRLAGDLWQGSGVRREERVDLNVGKRKEENCRSRVWKTIVRVSREIIFQSMKCVKKFATRRAAMCM